MTKENKLTSLSILGAILIVSLLFNLYLGLLRKKAFDLGASQAFFATGRELGRAETIDRIYKFVDEDGFVNITNSENQKLRLISDDQ